MAQSLHGQRVAAAVAATGGLLGSFLPWINAPVIGSVTGTAGSDGWVTMVISLLALLSALLGNRSVAMANSAIIPSTRHASCPLEVYVACGSISSGIFVV